MSTLQIPTALLTGHRQLLSNGIGQQFQQVEVLARLAGHGIEQHGQKPRPQAVTRRGSAGALG